MLHSLSSSWPWLVTFVPWCPGHGCCGKEDVQSLWYQEASSPKQVGRQEMGTGPGALPPLQLSLQSQQARMWQDTFILWGGQGIPCLCLDSANANWPLPNPQCNGKLQSYVSSLLPTTLVYLCLLENLFWGTNVISGMFCSHFAGMRWSGHFQVQTQRGGGLSWSSHIQVCTYLVIQVGPCFTIGCYQRMHQQQQGCCNRNISGLAIQRWLTLWNWASSRNAAQKSSS